ncbi:unnamed protein product [Dimorphilus gyrociliatus]|uniref:Uncharacterized protein n=1 Tax=Dimorphilus gyrociliatus TaxID=2664684 RepID=A0A7I8VY20_9ANNE|nr:unnamed protein product [Dimorphilus gyrociliatus]
MPPRRLSLQNEPKVTITTVDPDSDFHEDDDVEEEYSRKIQGQVQRNLLKVPALKTHSNRRHSIAAGAGAATNEANNQTKESPRRYSLDLAPSSVSSIMARTSDDFKKVLKDMNFKFVLEDIDDNDEEETKKKTRTKKVVRKSKEPNSSRKQVRWSSSTHKKTLIRSDI